MVRTTEPDVVLVDYVQLMDWPKGCESEKDALQRTMNELVRLAKRSRCAIVVATQMARTDQGRAIGPVQGGMGSGRIDQAADLWVRIDHAEDGASGHYTVRCTKNRHGPTGGEMRCKLDAKSGRIVPA
jgi:replicative DNA helicase